MTRPRAAPWAYMTAVSRPVSPDGHSPLDPASPNPAAKILISPRLGLPLANRAPLSLGLLTAWPWAPTHLERLPKSPSALRSPSPLQGHVCRCGQSSGRTWGSREEAIPRESQRAECEFGLRGGGQIGPERQMVSSLSTCKYNARSASSKPEMAMLLTYRLCT